MPDIGIFVIGALVTTVVVAACILVGQQEQEDARRQVSDQAGRNSRGQTDGS